MNEFIVKLIKNKQTKYLNKQPNKEQKNTKITTNITTSTTSSTITTTNMKYQPNNPSNKTN